MGEHEMWLKPKFWYLVSLGVYSKYLQCHVILSRPTKKKTNAPKLWACGLRLNQTNAPFEWRLKENAPILCDTNLKQVD